MADHDHDDTRSLNEEATGQAVGQQRSRPHNGPPGLYWFFRAQVYFVGFGALYLLLVILLCFPFFQRHMLYLNAVKIPFFADFKTPEKYGLAPNKTLNLKLHTLDNESIGAWFVLADRYYQALPSIPADVSEHVTTALKQRPTVLFFHGNAATRAFSVRVAHYEALTSRLNMNVLAVDYRGFADSTGTPSEGGLVLDAQAGWDWLISNGAKGGDILIMGHSLGTGVASQLGARFGSEGIKCRGIVLMSPFSSIREVLNSYNLFGFIPLIKPVAILPGATQLITWALVHKFDTLKAVPNITASVLIAHAENDWDIPDSHSDILFQAFLEPHLPELTLPSRTILSTEEWRVVSKQQEARQVKRDEILTHTPIHKFGRVDEFESDGRKVVLVKTHAGSHDYIGIQEGLHDIIRRVFQLENN